MSDSKCNTNDVRGLDWNDDLGIPEPTVEVIEKDKSLGDRLITLVAIKGDVRTTAQVPLNYLKISAIVMSGFEDDDESNEFIIPHMDPSVMEHLVYYFNYQKGVKGKIPPTPARANWYENLEDQVIVMWLENLWKTHRAKYLMLLKTVHYLDIECLFNIQCCHIGSMTMSVSLNEIESRL
jgi:hypothetical protein